MQEAATCKLQTERIISVFCERLGAHEDQAAIASSKAANHWH
jgi:hypothetical protein